MNVFEQALLNTLMGMGTVFAVLIFISLLISLFVYIPSIERALKNRSSKKEKKAAQEERPAPKRPILEEVVEEEELVDDGEVGRSFNQESEEKIAKMYSWNLFIKF